MTAVLVLYRESPPQRLAAIERLATVRTVRADRLGAELPSADVLLMWDFTSTALADLPDLGDRLRWIHVAGAGVDRALVPSVLAAERVLVTNSRGVFERPIAEYVAGWMLAFAKDLPGTLALQATGTWRHRETEMVAGRTAVVVGAGPIGREIGRLLSALGVRVRLVGRTRRSGDPEFGEIAGVDDLLDVVGDADDVISALPLTDRTTGMFDAEVFATMRPGARFMNIGRGALVVEPDLIEALRRGHLGGAGLDVFATEPLPASSPFWRMPNVLVSPHMSADFVGWLDALAEVFLANLDRFVAGMPLHNVVDKTLGYVKE